MRLCDYLESEISKLSGDIPNVSSKDAPVLKPAIAPKPSLKLVAGGGAKTGPAKVMGITNKFLSKPITSKHSTDSGSKKSGALRKSLGSSKQMENVVSIQRRVRKDSTESHGSVDRSKRRSLAVMPMKNANQAMVSTNRLNNNSASIPDKNLKLSPALSGAKEADRVKLRDLKSPTLSGAKEADRVKLRDPRQLTVLSRTSPSLHDALKRSSSASKPPALVSRTGPTRRRSTDNILDTKPVIKSQPRAAAPALSKTLPRKSSVASPLATLGGKSSPNSLLSVKPNLEKPRLVPDRPSGSNDRLSPSPLSSVKPAASVSNTSLGNRRNSLERDVAGRKTSNIMRAPISLSGNKYGSVGNKANENSKMVKSISNLSEGAINSDRKKGGRKEMVKSNSFLSPSAKKVPSKVSVSSTSRSVEMNLNRNDSNPSINLKKKGHKAETKKCESATKEKIISGSEILLAAKDKDITTLRKTIEENSANFDVMAICLKNIMEENERQKNLVGNQNVHIRSLNAAIEKLQVRV